MNSTDLLHIQILPVERIYAFEAGAEDAGESVDEELRLVRDPFPVVDLDECGYLLLQDTERFNAALREGLIHVPAQIVREPNLKVCCETIALPGLSRKDLVEIALNHPDDILPASDEQSTPAGYYAVYFRFADLTTLTLSLRHSAKIGCPDGFNVLFNEIKGAGRYVRFVEDSGRRDHLLKGSGDDTIMTIPGFTLADLRMAALSGDLFPSRIVRVVPDCRVIAIDFPISVLRADIPVEEKQSFLHDLISLREQANRTSVIEGRVYILNR